MSDDDSKKRAVECLGPNPKKAKKAEEGSKSKSKETKAKSKETKAKRDANKAKRMAQSKEDKKLLAGLMMALGATWIDSHGLQSRPQNKEAALKFCHYLKHRLSTEILTDPVMRASYLTEVKQMEREEKERDTTYDSTLAVGFEEVLLAVGFEEKLAG